MRPIKIKGLNDRIRELIFSTDKPMAVISRDMGLSRGVVNRWFNLGATPDTVAIVLICKYFNVSADWLLGLSDEKKPR